MTEMKRSSEVKHLPRFSAPSSFILSITKSIDKDMCWQGTPAKGTQAKHHAGGKILQTGIKLQMKAEEL